MLLRRWCIGALVVLGACGGSDDEVVVFGAASLTDALSDMELAFERDRPDVDVVVNAAGSSSLVSQIRDGAPADVLLTADVDSMERVGSSALDDSVIFATNEMVLAVEEGNPLGIAGLDDLDGAVVVLAAPEVPAGAYAEAVLECAAVTIEPASFEQSVRSVATKVRLGEADAGIVYRTDLTGGLDAIEIPAACQIEARYPMLVLSSPDDADAAAFAALVAGDEGQRILAAYGFGTP